MSPQRKISGPNWHLDGSTLTVHIPMPCQRRGGRKVILAPDGDAVVPAKPRPDETLIRALARAHRWKRMLEEVSFGGGDRRSRGRNAELRQPAAAADAAGAGDR